MNWIAVAALTWVAIGLFFFAMDYREIDRTVDEAYDIADPLGIINRRITHAVAMMVCAMYAMAKGPFFLIEMLPTVRIRVRFKTTKESDDERN